MLLYDYIERFQPFVSATCYKMIFTHIAREIIYLFLLGLNRLTIFSHYPIYTEVKVSVKNDYLNHMVHSLQFSGQLLE